MEILIQLFLKMVLKAAFGALFGAVFIRAAASWIAGKDVEYFTGYGVYFVMQMTVGVLTFISAFVIKVVMIGSGWEPGEATHLILICACVAVLGPLIAAVLIQAVLKVKYIRAILVALVTYGIALAVFGGIAFAIGSLVDA